MAGRAGCWEPFPRIAPPTCAQTSIPPTPSDTHLSHSMFTHLHSYVPLPLTAHTLTHSRMCILLHAHTHIKLHHVL